MEKLCSRMRSIVRIFLKLISKRAKNGGSLCLGQKGTRKKIFFYAGYWLEWFWGNNYQVEKREKVKFTDMDYDCIMIMYVQYI